MRFEELQDLEESFKVLVGIAVGFDHNKAIIARVVLMLNIHKS